jgi:hypothetical protein
MWFAYIFTQRLTRKYIELAVLLPLSYSPQELLTHYVYLS